MRNVLMLIIPIILFGCKGRDNKEITNNSVGSETSTVDSSNIYMDSAKTALISANDFVEKGIKGEMTNSKARRESTPFMKKFEFYYSKLSPEDTLIIYNYRIKKMNELVDLYIKYNPSK